MAYTASLRGYTFGDAQEWGWDPNTPAVFTPDGYRTQRDVVVGRDGATAVGADYAGSQLVAWGLVAVGSAAALEAMASRLRAAFAPNKTGLVEELTLTQASGSQILRGRPGVATIDPTQFPYGIGRARVVFEMVDPLRYNAASSTVSVTFGGTSGGMDTQLVTPMVTTGSGSSGDAAVSNTGTGPVEWVATINGPVTTPRLILGGYTIQLDADIPAGSLVAVDSRTASVTQDGQPRPWASFSSVWWQIPPGASTFSARAAAGTGTATLTWRDGSI